MESNQFGGWYQQSLRPVLNSQQGSSRRSPDSRRGSRCSSSHQGPTHVPSGKVSLYRADPWREPVPLLEKNAKLLKEDCWKGIMEPPWPGEGLGEEEAFIGKQWGYVGALSEGRRSLLDLSGGWRAQLRSSAVSTEPRRPACWAATSICRDVGEQWKRGRTQNHKTGVTFSPGTRCFISLNYYFPNWKTRIKIPTGLPVF